MKAKVCGVEASKFRAARLASDQVMDIWQMCVLIETDQVCFNKPRLHQMNPRQQDSIDVQQRFDVWWVLFLKQLPLSFRKTKVVMCMVLRDAIFGQRFQLIVLRRCGNNQG